MRPATRGARILISITPALYVLKAASFGLPLRMQWNAEVAI